MDGKCHTLLAAGEGVGEVGLPGRQVDGLDDAQEGAAGMAALTALQELEKGEYEIENIWLRSGTKIETGPNRFFID